MESKFQEIELIKLFPQLPQDAIEIKKLITKANATSPKKIPTIRIVYIMDIKNYDPNFSTLMFDNMGKLHKFTWSSKRIAETYFHEHGFSYESWSTFLRRKSQKTRTIFPYVAGNTVFIRIPVTGKPSRNYDWLNLSAVHSFDLNAKEPIKGEHVPDSLLASFIFHLRNVNKGRLQIILTDKMQTIYTQLKMAYHLVDTWYYYASNKLVKSSYNFHLTFRNYYDNPVFQNAHLRDPNYKLITVDDLFIFRDYAAVREYITGTNFQTRDKVSILLKSDNMDRHSLNHAIEHVNEMKNIFKIDK